jgi:hypothetical protein
MNSILEIYLNYELKPSTPCICCIGDVKILNSYLEKHRKLVALPEVKILNITMTN